MISNLKRENSVDTALVTTFYATRGGVSTYVKGVERALRNQGVYLAVISPDLDADEGRQHYQIRGNTSIWVMLLTWIQLLKIKPRQIHCHGAWYLVAGCILYKWTMALFLNRCFVAAVKHTEIAFEKFSLKDRFLIWLDQLCDCLVFVSFESRRRYLARNSKEYLGRTEVIWPGVDAGTHAASNAVQFTAVIGERFSGRVITYMGNMEFPLKVEGLIRLLEAFALVRQKNRNVKLLIAGRGSLETQVDDKIERLNLSEDAIRVGVIEDPSAFLRVSDLHCHISFKDNFPLVVLEALANGVGVVVNDVGDFTNLQLPGVHICGDESEDIAVAIERALREPTTVDAREVIGRMSWDKCAEKYRRLTCKIDH